MFRSWERRWALRLRKLQGRTCGEMVNFTINGRALSAPKGTTILAAARLGLIGLVVDVQVVGEALELAVAAADAHGGRALSAPKGTTILAAAEKAGIPIPHLCFLKDINEIAACRMSPLRSKASRSVALTRPRGRRSAHRASPFPICAF